MNILLGFIMANHKKSILILTPAFAPNVGGVETHLTDLTEYLRNNNYFTFVLTYQPITSKTKGPGIERRRNLEIHRYTWFSGNYFNIFVNLHPIFNFLYLTPYLGLRTFLFLLNHRKKIDIIHCVGLSTAFSGLIFKYVFHIPVIMTTETLFNFRPHSLLARVVKGMTSHLDTILAQSEQSKQEFVDLGVNPKKITVFSHWINQNIFKPLNKKLAKKKLGWENKFTALFVGRLIPEKGVRLVIDAVKEIGPNINLKIIGDDSTELEYVLKSSSKNINFLGKIPHNQLPAYYQAADVLIYPALYKEDMAYVLLDALSCGTPVINTNPGSGIYKLSPSSAFVISPKVSDIVKYTLYLVSHPEVCRSMSKSAARFARRFGPRQATAIINVYDQLN